MSEAMLEFHFLDFLLGSGVTLLIVMAILFFRRKKKITTIMGFAILTGWCGGMGIIAHLIGIIYETSAPPKAEGALYMGIGTTLIAFSGLLGIVLSKIQERKKQKS